MPTERVVLFGTEGGFSRPVLKRLLDLRLQVIALVMPDKSSQGSAFPVAIDQTWPAESLAGLAASNNLTVLRCPLHIEKNLVAKLEEINPAYLLVACYPYKLPATLWRSRRWHCWNLHPSLLPKYRGPDPLFWQLRRHETDTGVTLHQVTGELDAGSIITQISKALPAQVDADILNEWVAEIGVNLFLEALDQCRQRKLILTPQDETEATYFPGNE